MADRLITYGDSSYTLRLEFPDAWDAIPTAVTVAVYDEDATALLTAQSTTILSADALASAASASTRTVTLTTGMSLTPGDRLHIAKTATGPAETVVVESYNSSTKAATLVDDLDYDHSSAAVVSALWGTYALNASDDDDYPVNQNGTIVWTPNTDDKPFRETFRVAKFEFQLPGIEKEFAETWPVEYAMCKSDFGAVLSLVERVIKSRLAAKKRTLAQLVDHSLVLPALMYKLKEIALKRGGGDTRKTEIEMAQADFEREWSYFEASEAFFDIDEDLADDTNETRATFSATRMRSYH